MDLPWDPWAPDAEAPDGPGGQAAGPPAAGQRPWGDPEHEADDPWATVDDLDHPPDPRHRRRRRRAGAAGVAMVAVAMVAATVASFTSGSSGSASTSSSQGPAVGGSAAPRAAATRAPSPAAAQVITGPLFVSATSTVHLCTASVVDSPGGDLLLTAAHCVDGSGVGMSFAPDDVNGVAPYGRWTVVAAYATKAWVTDRDPAEDVAVLRVAPHVVDGRAVSVQQVVGGARLGRTPAPGTPVTVDGYGFGAASPRICQQVTGRRGRYPSFSCAGFVDGTSGGPWLTESSAAGAGSSLAAGSGAGSTGATGSARSSSATTGPTMTVVGVIGGLHQGGCRSAVSYSAPFGSWTARLLARASAGGPASVLPPLGPDGCPTSGS